MTTHLVHAPLDMGALCRWARARGLTGRVPFDAGYALHVLLSAMFGKGALQPFRVFGSERRRDGALYAYAEKDSTALRSGRGVGRHKAYGYGMLLLLRPAGA